MLGIFLSLSHVKEAKKKSSALKIQIYEYAFSVPD